MPVMTDLVELKAILEIDPCNHAEDKKLNFFIEQASDWIEEYLGRRGKLFYKQRTEIYNGTGTSSLLLKSRPVYEEGMQVWVDTNARYGSTEDAFAANTLLEFGRSYCLEVDEVGEPSRVGILRRLHGVWPRPWARESGYLTAYLGQDSGSVKVQYNGGYTIDTLPAQLRLAINTLVARMRYVMPLGMELGSESYEERNISLVTQQKRYLMQIVEPMLFTYRNWKW